jgi:hypothetical protein
MFVVVIFFHINLFRDVKETIGKFKGPNMFTSQAISLIVSYRSADKSLARPTSRCILFDGENISFDASLVIYINSNNIPPIMIVNKIYENQNLLSQ